MRYWQQQLQQHLENRVFSYGILNEAEWSQWLLYQPWQIIIVPVSTFFCKERKARHTGDRGAETSLSISWNSDLVNGELRRVSPRIPVARSDINFELSLFRNRSDSKLFSFLGKIDFILTKDGEGQIRHRWRKIRFWPGVLDVRLALPLTSWWDWSLISCQI